MTGLPESLVFKLDVPFEHGLAGGNVTAGLTSVADTLMYRLYVVSELCPILAGEAALVTVEGLLAHLMLSLLLVYFLHMSPELCLTPNKVAADVLAGQLGVPVDFILVSQQTLDCSELQPALLEQTDAVEDQLV